MSASGPGVDTREMVLIHRVIRREIGQPPGCSAPRPMTARDRGPSARTAVGAELPAWTASADPAAGQRMAATIDAMMPTLIDHLGEEEQKLLPIVSATS